MNARRLTTWAGAVALLLAGFLGAAGTANATNKSNAEKVSELLTDAKTMAVQVEQDAVTMASYSQLDMKWQSHSAALAEMRQDLMSLNQQLTRLKASEGVAEPWQKKVVARIEPYVNSLTEDNEAVLDEAEAHPSLFGTPAWNAYVQANANSAAYLESLIVNFIDNGALRDKMQGYESPEDTCRLMGAAHELPRG